MVQSVLPLRRNHRVAPKTPKTGKDLLPPHSAEANTRRKAHLLSVSAISRQHTRFQPFDSVTKLCDLSSGHSLKRLFGLTGKYCLDSSEVMRSAYLNCRTPFSRGPRKPLSTNSSTVTIWTGTGRWCGISQRPAPGLFSTLRELKMTRASSQSGSSSFSQSAKHKKQVILNPDRYTA